MSYPHQFPDYNAFYNCEHLSTAIRWRIMRNGQGRWVIQCLFCGREVRAISKNAVEVRMMTDRPPFDENMEGAIIESIGRAREDTRNNENEAWWNWYNSYLKTPEWHRRRDAVFTRCEGICEGCGINRATQVHHLTYDHAGDEFLFELVAVCSLCHSRLHPHLGEDYG